MASDFTNRENAAKMLHIWVEVSQGRGRHGGFLTAFSNAYVNADSENKYIIYQAAVTLVNKYGLEKYLDNFVLT